MSRNVLLNEGLTLLDVQNMNESMMQLETGKFNDGELSFSNEFPPRTCEGKLIPQHLDINVWPHGLESL